MNLCHYEPLKMLAIASSPESDFEWCDSVTVLF